jgi:tagatose 1,6-diphosphate aldolase
MPQQKRISFGKYRSLIRATAIGAKATFQILAIDHQDALKRAMHPGDPTSVTDGEMRDFKRLVVSHLSQSVTGVLLDPVYGAFDAIASTNLQTALLVELEKADYALEPMPLNVEIDPDWSVSKIKRMGADGVKLFYYYNPFEAEHAAHQDDVIRSVVADCAKYDIPFYAEPIVYFPEGSTHTKADLVVESAKRAAVLGVDVLKLEFPVNGTHDDGTWEDACRAITDAVDVPWVLLSAGVDFETFARQLEAACKGGASGYIVGRAIWGPLAPLKSEERGEMLYRTIRPRLKLLNAITSLHGRPWFDAYNALYEKPTTDTFRTYGDMTDE